MMLLLPFGLLLLSWAASAVMDKIQFHHGESIFRSIKNRFWYIFWNPKYSWMNKWQKNSDGTIVRINGIKQERFWGSSRWFVFVTDGWHLMQFVRNALVIAGFWMMLHIYWNMPLFAQLAYVGAVWAGGGALKEFMLTTLLKRK